MFSQCIFLKHNFKESLSKLEKVLNFKLGGVVDPEVETKKLCLFPFLRSRSYAWAEKRKYTTFISFHLRSDPVVKQLREFSKFEPILCKLKDPDLVNIGPNPEQRIEREKERERAREREKDCKKIAIDRERM